MAEDRHDYKVGADAPLVIKSPITRNYLIHLSAVRCNAGKFCLIPEAQDPSPSSPFASSQITHCCRFSLRTSADYFRFHERRGPLQDPW